MKKYLIAIIIIIVVVATIFWVRSKAVAPIINSNTTSSSTASANFKDLTFDIDGVKITLVNGQNEQKVPGSVTTTTTSYFGNEAKGDVNGDGKEDVAFLLSQDGGGSGLFTYLAVALKTENGYQALNTIFLGDRIAPQNTQISDGKIIANYADRLPTEPMTAQPSIGVSRVFTVENGKLVERKGEF